MKCPELARALYVIRANSRANHYIFLSLCHGSRLTAPRNMQSVLMSLIIIRGKIARRFANPSYRKATTLDQSLHWSHRCFGATNFTRAYTYLLMPGFAMPKLPVSRLINADQSWTSHPVLEVLTSTSGLENPRSSLLTEDTSSSLGMTFHLVVFLWSYHSTCMM